MLKLITLLSILTAVLAVRDPKQRVVNGDQVGSEENGIVQNPGTFPYIVFLRMNSESVVYDENSGAHVTLSKWGACGGSIIRSDIILTAAHCVLDYVPNNVTAFAGIVHVAKPQPSAQFIRGRRILIHESYQGYWSHDIALVFLKESFGVTPNVRLIHLASPSDYYTGMSTTAAGWGRDEFGVSTAWLKSGNFTLVDKSNCAIGRYNEKLLCVFDETITQKVCKGDSGGPLVRDNVLVGLAVGVLEPPTPLANGACHPSYPSVFLNVSYHSDWIHREIRNDDLYYRNLKT